MLTLLRPARRHVENITFQLPDGFDILRQLPIIRGIVPDNNQPSVTMPGRMEITDALIHSSVPLALGVKFDHTFAGMTYRGIMPVYMSTEPQYEGQYECKVDFLEN